MVSKTVLLALVLALVASTYARPGSSEEYTEERPRERQHQEDDYVMSKTITIRYYPHNDKSKHNHEQYKEMHKQNRDEHKQVNEDMNKYVKNSGKIENCDQVYEEDKPCVVQDGQKNNKKIMVQDTSSEEYDVTESKIIKAITSQEESDKINLRQGQKPTPVHQGKWARQQVYRENKHNVQQRRGEKYSEDFEETLFYGRVPETSQEMKNKVHKY